MKLSKDFRRRRLEIDALVLQQIKENEPYEVIANNFGMSVKSISKRARSANLGRGYRSGEKNNKNNRHLISKHIEELIEEGVLQSGDRLPMQWKMVIKFGVSESTVHNAYCDLLEKGVVTKGPTKRGKVVT